MISRTEPTTSTPIWKSRRPIRGHISSTFARPTKRSGKHAYVSFSLCYQICLNLGIQGGTVNLYLTGAATFDTISPAKPLIPGPLGNFAGVSVGWNTATPSDGAVTVGGTTVASGPYGGTYSYQRNGDGKSFHQFGWAGGKGVAIQGFPLAGVAWDMRSNKFNLTAGGNPWPEEKKDGQP